MAAAERSPKPPDGSEPGSTPFVAGIRLLARLARVAERACQTSGISLPQYRLLVSVSGRPQRASELAAHVGVSRPTLTSLVDGLERSGLLRRVPVPTDRRGIQLEPTQAGLAAVTRLETEIDVVRGWSSYIESRLRDAGASPSAAQSNRSERY